ncbi:hypothetical protein D3C81_1635410 [compost metagenome]
MQAGEGQAQVGTAAVEQLQCVFLRGAEQLDVQQRVALAQAGDGGKKRALIDVRDHGEGQAAFQPLRQLQCVHLQ